MKLVMLLCGLAVLLCMGLAVIIFGQHRVRLMMSPGLVDLGHKIDRLGATLEDREFLAHLLQQQLDKQKKVVEELDVEVNRITIDRDSKKNTNDACQVEKTKKNDELAVVEKDNTDTEATEKTEREAWTAEIQTLKTLHEERSKVCDFVKDAKSGAEKLCPGPPAKDAPPPPAAEKQA